MNLIILYKQGKGELFTYWLVNEETTIRTERIKRTSKKGTCEGLPFTPTPSQKIINGKVKGTPNDISPPPYPNAGSLNFQEANIIDLLRESDTKIPRGESPKRFLSTPFQNDPASNYSSIHGYTSYTGLKIPANGLTAELRGRSASGMDLASPTKQMTATIEASDRVHESDSLLVRHYSLGHKMRWKPNSLLKESKEKDTARGLKIEVTPDYNLSSETSYV